MTRRWLWPALILAMLVAGVLGVGIGSTSIAPGRALAALAGHGDPIERAILIELRLPRAILGLAVGAMLGLAGAALQGYLRNPLAEPSVLGASNGAALGAVVALYFGIAEWNAVALPVLAIAVVLWLRSTRLRVVLVPLTILVGVALAFTIPALLADTRLGQGAEDSDAGRILINEAAMRWFYDSPVFGGGYDVMHGVAVPIMVLSGGGIILAIGYYAFLLRPVPVLLAGRALPIAQMGLLSLLAFLAFGVLNPVWMERITYWPALIAALVILLRGREGIRTNPWSKGDRSHNPVKR